MNPRWTGAAAIAAATVIVFSFLGTEAAFASSQCGKATWYEAGGLTASGEEMTAGALTAAHATLPFGTQIEVENLTNGRTAIARVNDRGRFTNDRIVGVSRAVAEELGFIRAGVVRVRLSVIDGHVSLEGSCPEGPESVLESADEIVPLLRYPPETANTMSARFGLAFQPETWAEHRMSKALEALFTRVRGSE